MILCKICNIDKDENQFYFRKDSGKYRHECKSCILEMRKVYQLENKEMISARNKAFLVENREEINLRSRQSRERRKDEINARVRKNRKLNPEKYRTVDNKRYDNNKEVRKACSRRSYRNKAGHYAHIAKLRAFNKKRATPKWLTEEHKQQIKVFYEESSRLTKDTGIKYNVDHIIPINGEAVCGLHVPWNLRVITETENFKKSNKLLDEFNN